MDAFLSAFLAALIAGQGDASQLVALAAIARFGADRRTIAALLLAAALNAALSAGLGAGVRLFLPYRGALLMTALALVFAAGGMAFRAGALKVKLYASLGAFGAVLLAAFVQGFGDRTQFLLFALAARSDVPLLAGLGGAIGSGVALLPAILLGERFGAVWPVTALRRGGAVLFALLGLTVGLAALRLI